MPILPTGAFKGDEESKKILEYLTDGVDFTFPSIDWDAYNLQVPDNLDTLLNKEVDPVTLEELTERKLGGAGIFDALMESMHKHLMVEYDHNRITGAEYADAYIKLSEVCLTNAVQFALGKNQAYWAGVQAQSQAVIASIQAQVAVLNAKVQAALAAFQALRTKAEYAATTMQLANSDAQYALTKEQQETQLAQTHDKLSDGSDVGGLVGAQIANQKRQTEYIDTQEDLTNKQIDNIEKQMAVADAQITLYGHQGVAYKRDSETKAAKLFHEAYITMKSVDEGFPLPWAYNGKSINDVMQYIKRENFTEDGGVPDNTGDVPPDADGVVDGA